MTYFYGKHRFINWGWCGTFPGQLHAQISSGITPTCLSSPVSFSKCMQALRACFLGWWQVQPCSLFEYLDSSTEQLSNYTKIQEFKGSCQNFFFFFCAPMPPLVNNLIIFFPFFSKSHLPHSKITGKAQSQHVLEAPHLKISFKVTEGRNVANTFSWFLSYRF